MSKITIIEETTSWDTVRESIATVRSIGKTYLLGQCWLGWQLATLKTAHCRVGAGRPKKNSPDSGELIPWADLVAQEAGISRQSADIFIRLFEATKAKLGRQKDPESKSALTIFQSENPLALADEKAAELQDIIASLVESETQGSLMKELGVTPKPTPTPKGGGVSPKTQYTAGQLAFIFFEPLAANLLNTRSSAEFEKQLAALPLHPLDDEHPISLTTLEADARALLDKIEAAKAHHAKPARIPTR